MSLTHDPSAIRYTTTQSAYGQTWTYQSTEDSGCQVWRNSAGQTALVPLAATTVRSGRQSPDYSYGNGVDSLVTGANFTVQGEVTGYFPMTPEMKAWVEGEWDLTLNDYFCPRPVSGSQPEPLPATLVWKLMDIGQTKDQLDNMVRKPISDSRSGRISSTIINQSNSPKSYIQTPGSYVDEQRIGASRVTREWNGTRWTEVNKTGDRKISADASKEWEYDGEEWQRVR